MGLIDVISREGYEVWRLNRGRGNPINDALVTVIRQELARAKTDNTVRGLILTGNSDGIFSVGLDLKELYYFDEPQMVAFWENWQAMVIELAAFPKPMIAAINGHSPAGGCVLAVTCDYRLMAADDRYKIGLNEVAVGIAVPQYIFTLYSFWLGTRQAYQNLLVGRLLTATEAHQQNLVDELCEIGALLPRAEELMKTLIKPSDVVLYGTKKTMRSELMSRLTEVGLPDPQARLDAWFDPTSRAIMKAVVDRLSTKKKSG